MTSYDTPESYQVELQRILPKLRKIKQYEVDDIFDRLLIKIRDRVIKNAKELRRLGKVFIRAQTNELELYNFISNDDMTVEELVAITEQSGFAKNLEIIIDLMKKIECKERSVSSKELEMIQEVVSSGQRLLKDRL